MITIGIDPGLSGAVAWFSDSKLVQAFDLPTLTLKKKTILDAPVFADALLQVADILGRPIAVYLEQVHSMPMQGVASAFNFGRTYGEIRGVLVALGFDIHDVTPQQWKFAVGLRAVEGATAKDRKNASRARAIELFPEQAHYFQRAKDDGRAEAALIAWYGAQQETQP